MNQNARNAFNTLKRIGAPVLGPEMGWGGHFAISAENYGHDDGFYKGHRDEAPNGCEWANYYEAEMAGPEEEFGVNAAIIRILGEHGLFCEWQNSAILCVHDI